MTASHNDSDDRLRARWAVATVFARLALAAAFLSAVADRFGLWGQPQTGNVAWGNLANYTEYVNVLAPYLPGTQLDIIAYVATAVELVLGVALLLGVALRWFAPVSAATLLVFALSMFFFEGFESPLSASVFSASAAALLLALTPPQIGYSFSLDRLRVMRRNGPTAYDLGKVE